MNKFKFTYLIIGGGIIGSAIAYSLPKYTPPITEEPIRDNEGDETAPPRLEGAQLTSKKVLRKRSMLDFVSKNERQASHSNSDASTSHSRPAAPIGSTVLRKGTDPQNRGFNFCNTNRCRYCPKLNKPGQIESKTTRATFESRTSISCRSSNLIYCITCKVCKMQYVGQTSLRLKDSFVHHFLDIGKGDPLKTVSRHFSQPGHNGIHDLEIHVLEFIKKTPKSPAATIIRNRVEKRWIHLLRTLAPQGLNMED